MQESSRRWVAKIAALGVEEREGGAGDFAHATITRVGIAP
jgi:hypothetical protein